MVNAVNSTTVNKQRDTSIDVLKGILIIFVVIGHGTASGTYLHDYIYWFHMPLFFMISGFFLKKVSTKEELTAFIVKTAKTLLVPYFVYLVLINLWPLGAFVQQGDYSGAGKHIYHMLYGGRALGNENGVFWFISVLFLSRVFLGFLMFRFTEKQIIILVGLCLLASVGESMVFQYFEKSKSFPWNIDVVPIAAFFSFTGTMFKKYYKPLPLAMVMLIALIIPFLLAGDYTGLYSFRLDMKNSVYFNLPFVLVVPLVFLIAMLGVSAKLSKIKFLSDFLIALGVHSLTIMYLHIFINLVLQKIIGQSYNVVFFTIVGVLVPLLFSLIVSKNKTTNLLFLGK